MSRNITHSSDLYGQTLLSRVGRILDVVNKRHNYWQESYRPRVAAYLTIWLESPSCTKHPEHHAKIKGFVKAHCHDDARLFVSDIIHRYRNIFTKLSESFPHEYLFCKDFGNELVYGLEEIFSVIFEYIDKAESHDLFLRVPSRIRRWVEMDSSGKFGLLTISPSDQNNLPKLMGESYGIKLMKKFRAPKVKKECFSSDDDDLPEIEEGECFPLDGNSYEGPRYVRIGRSIMDTETGLAIRIDFNISKNLIILPKLKVAVEFEKNSSTRRYFVRIHLTTEHTVHELVGSLTAVIVDGANQVAGLKPREHYPNFPSFSFKHGVELMVIFWYQQDEWMWTLDDKSMKKAEGLRVAVANPGASFTSHRIEIPHYGVDKQVAKACTIVGVNKHSSPSISHFVINSPDFFEYIIFPTYTNCYYICSNQRWVQRRNFVHHCLTENLLLVSSEVRNASEIINIPENNDSNHPEKFKLLNAIDNLLDTLKPNEPVSSLFEPKKNDFNLKVIAFFVALVAIVFYRLSDL